MTARNRLVIAATATVAISLGLAGPASASFPGQERLAFARYASSSGDASAHTMRFDGSGVKTPMKSLGAGGPVFLSASLSPNGKQIVFTKRLSDTNTDLFLKTLGGGTTRLTNSEGIYEYSPTWSPNGKRIVYSETDRASYGAIMVARPKNMSSATPVQFSGIDYMTYPVWSPDGSLIAFSTSDGSDREIFTTTVDGGTVDQVTDNAGFDDYMGDWSPNGSKISYMRHVSIAPRMTPDASTIAWQRLRRGVPAFGDAFTMRADGTHRRAITGDTNGLGRVTWGPKKMLVLTRIRHDSFDMYAVSANRGPYARLTKTSETLNFVDLTALVFLA